MWMEKKTKRGLVCITWSCVRENNVRCLPVSAVQSYDDADEPSLLYYQGVGLKQTAQHWAATKGHAGCLKWLLLKGAPVHSRVADVARTVGHAPPLLRRGLPASLLATASFAWPLAASLSQQ